MSKTIVETEMVTLTLQLRILYILFSLVFLQTCYKGDLYFRNGLFVTLALVVMGILCTNFMNLIIFYHASPTLKTPSESFDPFEP